LLRQSQIREIAKDIAEAADGALEAYREERVTEEPAITGQIIGAIEERLRNKEHAGVSWRAVTLRTSRGVAAEEARHGADIMGVLDIDLPDLQIKKGFLAQAKRAEPNETFRRAKWDELREQCDTMLDRTPDAFVFYYSKQVGIRVLPAIEVLGSPSPVAFASYDRGLQVFFEQFIECFIGDRRLNAPNASILDDLVVDKAFALKARPAE
jgi:hypothetical protein